MIKSPEGAGRFILGGETDCSEMDWGFIDARLKDTFEGRANKSGVWEVNVVNYGWRRTKGYKVVEAQSMTQILESILPDADCKFGIYNYREGGRRGFAIRNYHHDNPTGSEVYYVLPSTRKAYREYIEYRGL